MNCLVISDTFPNRLEPWRGAYNRQQIAALARLCGVHVINPLPWIKVIGSGGMRRLLRTGSDDVIKGVSIAHPLHFYVPVLGRASLGSSVARAIGPDVMALARRGGFDVMLSTWAFPHGWATMRLAGVTERPFVIKLRGSDINALPERGRRRRLTAQALSAADGIVALSSELADAAVAMGAAPERVTVLHNGVDSERFRPEDRAEARERLGLPAGDRIVLFVGSLLPVKGPDVLLSAFGELLSAFGELADPQVRLVVAGDGPWAASLRRQATDLGIADRLSMIGHVPHTDLPALYSAADLLCVPSRSEGCPNVVLESLACGTPVVGSQVGAIPDLVTSDCGAVVPPDDPAALCAGLRQALDASWDRTQVRARAEGMTWADNARKLHAVLQGALAGGRRG